MGDKMDMREFTSLCKSKGFIRLKPYYYARCIGDGVFQTIHSGDKRYINPFSAEYAANHRKANSISIGIWSLYAKWDNLLELEGWYSPVNLIGMKEVRFDGFEAHCRIMIENGFDFLDGITDQEKLLNERKNLDSNLCTGKWIHDCWLSAPLMVCGRWEDATYEVCRHYTQSWEIFHSEYDSLRNEQQYEVYFAKEKEMEERLKLTRLLWHALLVRDQSWIQGFLTDNLERNTKRLRERGISVNTGERFV